MVNSPESIEAQRIRSPEAAESRQETRQENPALVETVESLDRKIADIDSRIGGYTESMEETSAKLAQARAELGMPPMTTEAPSIVQSREAAARLKVQRRVVTAKREKMENGPETQQWVALVRRIEHAGSVFENTYVSPDEVLQEIVASQLNPDQKTALLAELSAQQPGSVLDHYSELDDASKIALAGSITEGLMAKDPIKYFLEGDKLWPPPLDAQYDKAMEQAVVVQPFDFAARFRLNQNPRLERFAPQLVEGMLTKDPYRFATEHLRDYAKFVTPVQRTALTAALQRIRPEAALQQRKLLELTSEDRDALLSQALQPEHFFQLTEAIRRDRFLLTPPEWNRFFTNALEHSPNTLIGMAAERAGMMSADQRAQLVRNVLTAQPERVMELLTRGIDNVAEAGTFLETEDPSVRQVIAKGLVDRFVYSMDGEDVEQIKNQHARNRDAALTLFDKLPSERQQELLPSLLEHAMDPDVGSPDIAKRLIERVQDSKKRESYELLLERGFDDHEARRDALLAELKEVSERNTKRMYEDLTSRHGKERVDMAVERIRQTNFLTINMSLDALEGVVGLGRVQTTWENKNKAREYYTQRDLAERELGIRAKGTEKDPHAVYAAMGFDNGSDSQRGAVPDYGSCFVVLKEHVKQRAVSTYMDTFSDEVSSRRMTYEDAAIGRAKLELDKPVYTGAEYIDTQIMGGVTIDDIASLNIPKSLETNPEVVAAVARMRTKKQDIVVNFV